MTMIRSVADAYILLLICICVRVCVFVRGLQFVIVYMYHFLKKARTADGSIECSIMSLKNCTILTKSILEKYMKKIYILFEFFYVLFNFCCFFFNWMDSICLKVFHFFGFCFATLFERYYIFIYIIHRLVCSCSVMQHKLCLW